MTDHGGGRSYFGLGRLICITSIVATALSSFHLIYSRALPIVSLPVSRVDTLPPRSSRREGGGVVWRCLEPTERCTWNAWWWCDQEMRWRDTSVFIFEIKCGSETHKKAKGFVCPDHFFLIRCNPNRSRRFIICMQEPVKRAWCRCFLDLDPCIGLANEPEPRLIVRDTRAPNMGHIRWMHFFSRNV